MGQHGNYAGLGLLRLLDSKSKPVRYSIAHGKMGEFIKAVSASPELAREFEASRKKFIEMKEANPSLCLRDRKDIWPQRLVQLFTQSKTCISAPKQYLCELSTYRQKYGEPQASQIVTREFQGRKISGVMVTKEEDEGVFAIDQVEETGVLQTGQTSDVQLRDSQATDSFKCLSLQLQLTDKEPAPIVLVPNTAASSTFGSEVQGSIQQLNNYFPTHQKWFGPQKVVS